MVEDVAPTPSDGGPIRTDVPPGGDDEDLEAFLAEMRDLFALPRPEARSPMPDAGGIGWDPPVRPRPPTR